MPTQTEHQKKAEHNRQFVSLFDVATTPFLDWVITGQFYVCVHLVDGYLATKGEHPKNHRERDDQVMHYLVSIWADYRALKDASRDARYDVIQFTPQDVNSFSNKLTAIEAHISHPSL